MKKSRLIEQLLHLSYTLENTKLHLIIFQSILEKEGTQIREGIYQKTLLVLKTEEILIKFQKVCTCIF